MVHPMSLPRAATLVGLLLLYHDAQAETAPRARVLVVTLPAAGEGQEALAADLADAIARAGLEPVTAEQVAVSLPARIAQDVARLEEAARERELALDFRGALETRREIARVLEGTLEAAVSPGRLASALSQVAATEVATGSRRDAVRLWRRALALDASLDLDGTYSPSARDAFDEARREGATLPPRPSPETLDRLCGSGRLAAVLWAAEGRDEQGPALVRLLHVPGQPGFGEIRNVLPEGDGARRALLATVVGQVAAALAPLTPVPDPPNGDPRPTVRPWWRRWWVWTLVGLTAAGAGTAAGLALGLGERQVEVVIRLP